MTTGYFVCLNQNGLPAPGVIVHLRFRSITNDTGIAFDRGLQTAISDENGRVEFKVQPGAAYEGQRGEGGGWLPVNVPADATDPCPLPTIWGLDL